MSIDRIDMENITERYAELRDERAELAAALDEAVEAEGDAGILAESDEDTQAEREAVTEARAALDDWDTDNADELAELGELIEELRGAGGGDHQWEGDWFPRELIAESDFQEYAQELAEDCGMVNEGASWPNNCIDWERAARELAMDYSMVSFRGTDYYWR